ncbi:MAG: ABC transporter ATP-binding protein [Synergistaceae bacterium]|nr:ABC transporter ATP-binding protein [Synergistota bacterium]NLM71013.1 ABC transporter ATP-binding protein [Synergistaceae bacterium]
MQNALSIRNLTKRFGSFTAVDGVSFDVEDGSFFSILGPSGCGKTTLLRMIAGFYRQDEGTILLNDVDMEGVAPNRRPVNLVFQNLALFPMMNVFENVAFGLRRRGEKGTSVERKVEDMLERVGLPGSGKKEIHQLSGGQKQRIAIARCLVLEPAVLLLDEPLGALDAKLREHMKVELKALQSKVGTTFVYITHDQSEAMVMSDTVAVMNNGIFEQIGSPQELYHSPRSSFVAQFVGANNKLPVTLRRSDGKILANYSGRFGLKVPEPDGGVDEEASYDLFVRPESMVINPPEEDERFNSLPVAVKAILFDGGNSRLLVSPDGSPDEFTVALPQTRQFDHIRARDRIRVGWNPSASLCFPAEDWKMYDEE